MFGNSAAAAVVAADVAGSNEDVPLESNVVELALAAASAAGALKPGPSALGSFAPNTVGLVGNELVVATAGFCSLVTSLGASSALLEAEPEDALV